jgi:hypothetical protein
MATKTRVFHPRQSANSSVKIETHEEYEAIVALFNQSVSADAFDDKLLGKARSKMKRMKVKGLDVNSGRIFCAGHEVIGRWDCERRRLIIEAAHVSTAHSGSAATFARVRLSYFGITQDDCEGVLKDCAHCQRYNSKKKEHSELSLIHVEGPWEHVEMDLIDLKFAKEDNDGFSWVLSAVDHFSR